MKFRSAKTYGHDAGFSCAFRQHRAESHCRLLHGYALKFCVVFEAVHLDDRNWVVDFGSLKHFKAVLGTMFDHTTVVAKDDPALDWFQEADRRGLIDLRIVDAVGCESFALLAAHEATAWLETQNMKDRVRVFSVTVSEHDGNSAMVVA